MEEKNQEEVNESSKTNASDTTGQESANNPEETKLVPETPETKQPEHTGAFMPSMLDLTGLQGDLQKVRDELKKYLIGQYEMVDLMLIAILSDGHILLEGVPGIAKTLTAKLMAQTVKVDFMRIQFTPDLMPSDIIGTSVFNMKSSEFSFNKGPIFSNIVLIDEINRAPAKTQSALFEVMEEKQITIDGETYRMKFPFMVVATQNPVEQEGTYRLPEAQLDRFLFRILLNYPSLEEEQQIMQRFSENRNVMLTTVNAVITPEKLKEYRELVGKVRVEPSIIKYISEITHETRNHGRLYLGASPRASLAMMHSAKSLAAMRGRDFVIPDDVQYVAPHTLNHRIIMNPESEMEGMTPIQIIQEIIAKVEVPR